MAELSSEEIAHLGRLARIELTLEEQSRFAGQLTTVVGYVEQLSQVDTSKVTDIKGVTGLQNVLMADVPRTESDPLCVSREDLLAGAPAHVDKYVEVRAVLGDEPVSA